MKKIILIFLILLTLNLFSCSKEKETIEEATESPAVSCFMNQCIKIDSERTEELSVDLENERFIWVLTSSNDEIVSGFDFSFSYYVDGSDYEVNFDEFIYTTSDGETIQLHTTVGDMYYLFNGSKTFYISYANISEQAKDAIKRSFNKDELVTIYVDMYYHDWVMLRDAVNYQ